MFKYQHGLCVMRAQPFHIGHRKLVDKMLKECAHVTIVLGSIQEHGTERSPLTYETRKCLIQNIYQGSPEYKRLTVTGLCDINNPAKWGEFVFDFMRATFPKMPLPDAYYAGSSYDAHWFTAYCPNIVLVDRTDPHFPFVSGTMVRDMIRFKDLRWKTFVAPENHEIIEANMKELSDGKTME